MKKVVCSKLIFLAFLCTLVRVSHAQDYVLTAKGDSLVGDIRPMFYGPDKKVQIVTADKQKMTLSMFQVRAFSANGDIYHPVKGERGYEFMKLIKQGYLSLYAFQLENQSRFDGQLLKKMDGDFLVVPNLGFRKYMTRFLEDCPSVVQQLEEGDLGKKDLHLIIDSYNTCIQELTPDVITAGAVLRQQAATLNVWHSLEEKVGNQEFSEKTNALEMIAEIRKKIERREAIPNFLIEGLRNSLRDTGLTAELERALAEIQ